MRSINSRTLAAALGGNVVRSGRNRNVAVLAPGPGHSKKDRSLSVKIEPYAPDGFLVFSFVKDDPIKCRDYVRSKLGLPQWQPSRAADGAVHDDRNAQSAQIDRAPLSTENPEPPNPVAMKLWGQSRDPRGTIVERYLKQHRGLDLPEDLAGSVIRFHPRLSLGGGTYAPAMVCLFRSVETDEPRAIHRTFLTVGAGKLYRKMLGPVRGSAIKLDRDDVVTEGLHIGEGVETCLAARAAGLRPIWAVGSAGSIALFPVLSGIGAITILSERNDNGANLRATNQCAARWQSAGREVFSVLPMHGDDFADAWRQEAIS